MGSPNFGNFTSVIIQSGVTTDDFDFVIDESKQFVVYKVVAYVFGTIIFLSNLTVVISSGLILKKGKQPKSTYLLLGNVSLADTIIGISVIFGVTKEDILSNSPMCVFQIGMLVCPAMVSIFSVGLIAVDRYIYILHGLYYQRWFNTTKVRIGILCIWLIGISLGFLPASGWVNKELEHSRCYYVTLFPGALILLNSLLSIIPIILVAVLYFIILVRALKNVKEINAAVKVIDTNARRKPELRMYRGNTTINKTSQFPIKHDSSKIRRSASFSAICSNTIKSSQNRSNGKLYGSQFDTHNLGYNKSLDNISNNTLDFSISSINSSLPDYNDIGTNNPNQNKKNIKDRTVKNKTKSKVKEPNKWRAITVVMLTSSCFIFTWMPYFVTVIFFVFCQEKLTNMQCMHLRILLSGPIATLAFFNSILNPLIYAWWHKGFKRSIKSYYQKHLLWCVKKDTW